MKKIILCAIITGSLIANNIVLETSLINSKDTTIINDKKLNVEQLFNYIKQHRKYVSDYSLATINTSLSSYRTNNHYNRSSNITSYIENEGQERAMIELNYPLYDDAKSSSMTNNKLRDNQSILRYINTYFKAIDTNIANKNSIQFYQTKLKEEQAKPKNNRGYITIQFNGKTILQSNEIYYSEQILEYKNKLISDIDIIIAKEQLLNLVEDNSRNRLENLL